MIDIDYSWDLEHEESLNELKLESSEMVDYAFLDLLPAGDVDSLKACIEALLFMTDRPLSLDKIKSMIDDKRELRTYYMAVSQLQKDYEAKNHGIRLTEVAQGYQFRTKIKFAPVLRKAFSVKPVSLSQTALEVLAIVAYRGPVSKNSIEDLRGVDSSHIVRLLMDKKLLKVVGKSDELGKPVLYGVTNEFLELFSLNTLDELTSESEIVESLDAKSASTLNQIKHFVESSRSHSDFKDEFAELESLSNTIKNIESQTSFLSILEQNEKKSLRPTQDSGVDGQNIHDDQAPLHRDSIPRLSAFDLIEKFISEKEVISQNHEALKSMTLEGPEDFEENENGVQGIDRVKLRELLSERSSLDHLNDEGNVQFKGQENDLIQDDSEDALEDSIELTDSTNSTVFKEALNNNNDANLDETEVSESISNNFADQEQYLSTVDEFGENPANEVTNGFDSNNSEDELDRAERNIDNLTDEINKKIDAFFDEENNEFKDGFDAW